MDATVQPRFRSRPVGLMAAAPSGSGSGPADQVRDRKPLEDEEVMRVDETAGELVGPVGSTVPDVAMRGRDPLHRPSAALGASLFGGQGPLSRREAPRSPLAEPVIGGEVTVARGDKDPHPQVDANAAARLGKRFCGHVHAADRDPPASTLPPHRDRLRGAPEWPMPAHLDRPDPEEVQTPGRLVEPPPVAVLPLQRIPTTPRPKPREPGPLAGLAAPIEALERPVKAPQRPPTHRHPTGQHLRAHPPQARQRAALIHIRHRAVLPTPRPPTFLQSRVVQLALPPQQPIQGSPLPHRRTQQEPKRTTPPHGADRTERL